MRNNFVRRLRRALRIMFGQDDHDPDLASDVGHSVAADIAHRLCELQLFPDGETSVAAWREVHDATLDGLRLYDRWRRLHPDERDCPW